MHKVIKVTDVAREQALKLLAEENQGEGSGLRLGIKGGGCSGLSYVLEFTDPREGDTVLDFDGLTVLLDRKSTIYLGGITLDFEGGLGGRGFVFENPAATNTCGCGESFSL